MRRGLKIFGGIFLALVVLAAVLLVQSGLIRPRGANLEIVLAAGDDAGNGAAAGPGAIQQWFVNSMRDATGRDLDIDGEFAAWMLPVPGLVMGKASLSNAAGFGATPFASIDGLELRVGSISPFDMEMEIERAALAGLRLNFMRDAGGRDNWSSFGDDAGTPAGGTTATGGAMPAPGGGDGTWAVAIDRFEIIDAEITLQDAFASRDWKLSGVEFQASRMREGEAFPLSLSFTYVDAESVLTIESAARATTGTDRWRLDELSVASSGSGTGWLGLLGDASLAVASVDADFATSRTAYEGIELRLSRFDPAEIAAVLESLDVTIDPTLLARASASASIHLSGGGTVDQGARTLDLTGNLRLSDDSVVPLTIGGTFDEPSVEVAGGP